MKRIAILFAAFFLAMQLNAQDVNLLNRIKDTNGKIKSFEADLPELLRSAYVGRGWRVWFR